jgi:hypothetical protein
MNTYYEVSKTTGHIDYISTLLRDGKITEAKENPGVKGAYQVTWRINGFLVQGSCRVIHPTNKEDVFSVSGALAQATRLYTMPPKIKTLADLLKEESRNLVGFVYSSFPFSCGLGEAITHTTKTQAPPPAQMDITREPNRVTISIKPLKGSRKRKPLVIKLWTTT